MEVLLVGVLWLAIIFGSAALTKDSPPPYDDCSCQQSENIQKSSASQISTVDTESD